MLIKRVYEGHGGFFEFFAATFDFSARELSLVPTSSFPGTLSRIGQD